MQNRMNEIPKLVLSECWSHCPGQENPTDMPSRDLTTTELAVSKLWQSGREWLIDEINVDCDQRELTMPTECNAELKPKYKKMVHSLLNCQSPTPSNLESIICDEKYSTLSWLLRVKAYVLRFISLLNKPNGRQVLSALEPEEIAEAERLWIIQSQSKLMQDKQFDLWKKQFGLFLDQTGVESTTTTSAYLPSE